MLSIRHAKIDDLKPHPANYRRHPGAQRRHLKRSIAEHGLQKPIVITADGTILAGHGLVEAAKAAGLSEVPVQVYDGPDPNKYLVADNESVRLAEDDEAALLTLLQEIDDLEGTGIDAEDLESLLEIVEFDGPSAQAEPVENQVEGRYLLAVIIGPDEEAAVRRLIESGGKDAVAGRVSEALRRTGEENGPVL